MHSESASVVSNRDRPQHNGTKVHARATDASANTTNPQAPRNLIRSIVNLKTDLARELWARTSSRARRTTADGHDFQ